MGFLISVIGGALGLGAIGQALIGIGVAVALGLAARALTPKKQQPGVVDTRQGLQLSLITDPETPRHVVIGRTALAGSLVYWQLSGADNRMLDLVIALADHECDALESVYVNGKAVTLGSEVAGSGSGTNWSAAGGYPVSEFPDKMWIKWRSGAIGQVADAELVARSGGVLDANFVGHGVAHVRISMIYDAELYSGGLPTFLFVPRGLKLFDPRTGTSYWSRNAALAWHNWRRGIWAGADRFAGMSTPETALDLDSVMAEANICDEAVGLKAGGTEARYSCDAVIPVSTVHREVIRGIITAMAGEEIDSGGTVRTLAGAQRTVIMTVTDDDVRADEDVEAIDRRSRRELVNAVFGMFRSPARLYEMTAAPPRLSFADQVSDGGVRLEERYTLDYVTSQAQAQRVLEIFRRTHRHQERVAAPFLANASKIEAGDWITWTSARHGWTRTFKVVNGQPREDLSPTLVLQRVTPQIFAWVPADDELDLAAPTNLPAGAGLATEIAGFDVDAVLIETAEETQIPALLIEWTPITDQTVVAIEIEYRIFGDAVAQRYTAFEPEAGNAVIVSGIQGNVVYEARARMRTQPVRQVEWTAWTSAEATAEHIVDVSNLSLVTESAQPDSITPEMLSAQARFELRLATAIATVQGSIAQQLRDSIDQAQRAGAAAIQGILDGHANKVRVVSLTQEVGDLSAQWGVAIVMDGPTPRVLGLVKLDGSAAGSTFSVVADKLTVAQPGVTGGSPVPVFTIGNVNGTPSLVFVGNMYADGSILARSLEVLTLSAISGDIGTVTAGRIQSNDGNSFWDLDTGEFQIFAA